MVLMWPGKAMVIPAKDGCRSLPQTPIRGQARHDVQAEPVKTGYKVAKCVTSVIDNHNESR